MLKSLEIQNYALIQHVRLDMQPGLTAITGETGSGKSILMGALGLLLGERADLKTLVKKDVKCVVEATFDVSPLALSDFFSNHDLDAEQSTTIRREITPAGKSRAFINDTPVSLSTLKEFGDLVIDIHSQHENQQIHQRAFRYALVDAFNADTALFAAFVKAHDQWQKSQRQRAQLDEQLNALLREQDYRLFQLQELELIQLDSLDQHALENERDQLSHADHIIQALQVAIEGMDNDQNGQLSQLRSIRAQLQKVASYSAQVKQFDERLNGLYLEMRELSAELNQFADQVQSNPHRLEQVQETLSQLYHLQQKHRVQSVESLRELEGQLRNTTQSTQALETELAALDQELAHARSHVETLATSLSDQRQQSALAAATEIQSWFAALGLEQAQLSFTIEPSAHIHALGCDEIEWHFSANPGVSPQPLGKIASGGEIARVMLAIKAVLCQRRSLPVLILDEIDQGVSGEVGKKIGHVLKQMSTQMQLITITHLAQIAGQASHQLKVWKRIDQGQTLTEVKSLLPEERIDELAEMISGKSKSIAALANARELLN